MPLRDQLQGLLERAREPGRRLELEEQLAVPALPPEGRYLWSAFGRLSGRRRSSGFGPLAIGWTEIDAFSRLTRSAFAPWEIEIIEMLDHLFLKTMLATPSESEPAQ